MDIRKQKSTDLLEYLTLDVCQLEHIESLPGDNKDEIEQTKKRIAGYIAELTRRLEMLQVLLAAAEAAKGTK